MKRYLETISVRAKKMSEKRAADLINLGMVNKT
jgi:hypothetical protein